MIMFMTKQHLGIIIIVITNHVSINIIIKDT